MSGTRALIWDWNGTLLDDVEACIAAVNTMLSRRGLPRTDAERYRKQFGFPVRGYYELLGFDFTRDRWNDVCVEYHALYESLARSSPLRTGAEHLLDDLRIAGCRNLVLSASETSLLKRMVEARGLGARLNGLHGLSDLHGRSKAHLGRSLLRELALPPGHVLMIGDTAHDSETAAEAGCGCVLMEGGHASTERLLSLGRPVLRDIPALREWLAANFLPGLRATR